jgi:hypothetical protein
MTSDEISEAPTGEQVRLANLKPWPKGYTPTLGGGRGRINRALAAELQRVEAFYGRPPTIDETLQAEALTLARLDTKSQGTDRAVIISRISGRLYGGPAAKPAAPRPAPSLTSAELLARHRAPA